MQSLFCRAFLFTSCLVDNFSLYIWVELYFQIFFGRVSFENRVVEISLQRACGKDVSSNTFVVEVSVEICLV